MNRANVAVGRVLFLFATCSTFFVAGMICLMYAKNGRGVISSKSLTKSGVGSSKSLVESVQECPWVGISNGAFLTLKSRMLEERRNLMQNQKRVYVQHQFKCGGSTLCKFFRMSNLSTPNTHNCNGEEDLRRITNGSVEELEEYLLNKPYQVVFNEKRLFGTDLPVDKFIFVTTSREPVSRLVSAMLQTWQDLEVDDKGIVKNLTEHVESFLEHGTRNGKTSHVPQNPQVLNLAGVPKSSAGDWFSLYNQALHNLQQFTFTIPTDELKEGLEYLGRFFGQEVVKKMESTQGNFRDAASQVLHLQRRNPELLYRIEMENRYDRCVYNQVVALWKAQQQALDEILEEQNE